MHTIQSNPKSIDQFHPTKSGVSGQALIALILALLTGLTLGQLALVGGNSFEWAPVRSTEATRTGLEFYDALAVYLTTGKSAELRALAHPDFVDHTEGQPATNGVSAFLRQLESLRAFARETGLTAKVASSNGNFVRFSLSIPPDAQTSILGLPVAPIEARTFSDTLRIDDGCVAERWSDLQLPARLTVLASTAWDPPAASQMHPAVKQLTMLSGSTLTLQLGTAHVILVETGTLTITTLPRSSASSLPEFPSDSDDRGEPEPIIAAPDSAVVAADSAPYRISNEGPAAASALLIRITGYALSTNRPEFSSIGTSMNDHGVQLEILSSAFELPHHTGDWTIDVGRVTLSPGSIIPDHEVTGAELIVVEQGALEADLGTCKADCIQTKEGAGSIAQGRVSVWAGQGISASNGATTTYRVASSEPVTFLLVTVAPA